MTVAGRSWCVLCLQMSVAMPRSSLPKFFLLFLATLRSVIVSVMVNICPGPKRWSFSPQTSRHIGIQNTDLVKEVASVPSSVVGASLD